MRLSPQQPSASCSSNLFHGKRFKVLFKTQNDSLGEGTKAGGSNRKEVAITCVMNEDCMHGQEAKALTDLKTAVYTELGLILLADSLN